MNLCIKYKYYTFYDFVYTICLCKQGGPIYTDKDITLNKNETIKCALKLVVAEFVSMYGVFWFF